MEHELWQHWRVMVRAAKPLVGLEDAKDCASEAITQFLERRPDVCNLEAFLVAVAKRRAVDRLRSRSRALAREQHIAREVAAALPDVAEDVAARAEASWADSEARRLLSPRSYELLLMVAEGLTVREIATQLGINEHAVESRLLRARRTARGALARGLAALGLGVTGLRRWLAPAGVTTAAAAAFVVALLHQPVAPWSPAHPPLPPVVLLPEKRHAAVVQDRVTAAGARALLQPGRAVVEPPPLVVGPPQAAVQTRVAGLTVERRRDGRRAGAVAQLQQCLASLRVEIGYQGCGPAYGGR